MRALTLVAVTFLLTRTLETDEFGLYGASMAVATTGTFIAFAGAPYLVMKRVTRGGDFALEWARMLSTMAIGSALSLLGLVAIIWPLFLSDVPLTEYTLFVATRVMWMGFGEASVTVSTAHKDLRFSALLRNMNMTGRLLAAAVLALGFADGLTAWAWLFFAFSAVATVIMLLTTARRFGGSFRFERPTVADVREGAPLAAKFSTASLLDSVDRPVLVSFGFQAEAGVYQAGYAIAGLGHLPVTAVVRATTPDFFASGKDGLANTIRLARRLVGPTAAIGLLSAGVTWLVAEFIVSFLGEGFGEAATVVRWLAIVPMLKALQHFPANALTGADAPGLQVACLVAATAANLALNLALVPTYDLMGAIWATLVAEVLYAVLLWSVAIVKARHES